MRICTVLFLVVSLATTGFSQSLDEAFDDGDKDSKLFIGTNLNTNATGTINLYGDYHPTGFFRLSLGLGFMPFNTFRDYSLALLSDGEIPSKYENLSGGRFLSIGIALKSGRENVIDFDYYYYAMFRNRNFGQFNDIFRVRQRSINLGIGYLVGLPGRFNLDIMLGTLLGRVKVYENFLDKAIVRDSYGVGFEATFGINYAL